MSDKKPLTVGRVKLLADKYRNIPKVNDDARVISKTEAVKMLMPEIRALRKKGYTLEQIADMLREDEIDITMNTLKSYIQRLNRSKQSSATAKPNKPVAPPGNTEIKMGNRVPANPGAGAFNIKPDSDDI
jgi:hypothetical protein